MAVNQMKNRMQALGLLDRSFKAASDEDLAAAIDALGDDHREGLESFVDDVTPDGVRAGVKAGRIDGGMEAIAAIVTDAALADCIEQLGDNADNPSSDQLREVMPGIVERHNVGIGRIMLASHSASPKSPPMSNPPTRAEASGDLVPVGAKGKLVSVPSIQLGTPETVAE